MKIKQLPELTRHGRYVHSVNYLEIANLNGSVNTTSLDHNIGDNEMSYAQNFKRGSGNTLETRGGIDTYGQFLGPTTGILGGYEFLNIAGNQENLTVYDTNVYRYVSGVWTALTSVTMTTNKATDGCFFPFTNKFYIVNKTDNVVKYTSGTAGDQTDAAFPKGAFVRPFFNRILVAGATGSENTVDYSDDQTDTFTANFNFQVGGTIVGMEVLDQMLLIFTNNNVYRLAGFSFDGTDSFASKLDTLPSDFGAIIGKTVKKVGNKIYFLGLDANRKAAIYMTDGVSVLNVSETKVGYTMDQLAASQLASACAATDGWIYHLWVCPSGEAHNNLGILYDTVRQQFLPFETRYKENIAPPSFAWNFSLNGSKRILIGSQVDGQIFILNNNILGYDVLPEEQQNVQASGRDFKANPSAGQLQRPGQSFKLGSYNTTMSLKISKIGALLKYVSGTQTDLQLVIRSSSQTGTVVATSDTMTAFSTASYIWKEFIFTTPPSLSGGTTYYFQIKHVTEGSGNSVYNVGTNTSGGYTDGTLFTYINSAWSAVSSDDMTFRVYVESVIDSYINTKAFHPAGIGFEYHAKKFCTFYGTSTEAALEIGFAKNGQVSFQTYTVSPQSGNSATWGGSDTWGGGALWGGAQQRQYVWNSIENLQGDSVKAQVRNRQPNKTVYFEAIVFAYNPKQRMQ